MLTSSFPTEPSDSRNAGVFVADLARLLALEGDEATVVTPRPSRGWEDEPFVVRSFWWPGDEASLTHVNTFRAVGLLRLAILMLSGATYYLWIAWRNRIEHSLACWAIPSGLFAYLGWKLLGVPYSVWALGSDIWRIADYPFGPRILRSVLREARHVYADGIQLAEEVERRFGGRCRFLATSRFPRVTEEPAPPPDLEVGPHHLLCVARYHRHKGVDVLVRAVAELDDDALARVRLHIFGGGPQADELRRLITSFELDDVVELNGYIGRELLVAYLRSVDALVIPSRVESIPVLLSDAVGTSCPVIVTDVGDMGRLVSRHAVGVVVPPERPSALAEAIRDVIAGAIQTEDQGFSELGDLLSLERSVARLRADLSVRH